MNTFADDVATLFDALDLRNVTMVGHSTGGGEVTRYIGRHGTSRVAKAVLIAAVPPIMVKSPSNPEGLPIGSSTACGPRSSSTVRSSTRTSRRRSTARTARVAGLPGNAGSVVALEHAGGTQGRLRMRRRVLGDGLHGRPRKFDVPTLVMHGEDDQSSRSRSAKKSARLIKGAKELFHPGLPHGLTATHAETRQPRPAPRAPSKELVQRAKSGGSSPEAKAATQTDPVHSRDEEVEMHHRA